jgi:hypothetical protein
MPPMKNKKPLSKTGDEQTGKDLYRPELGPLLGQSKN